MHHQQPPKPSILKTGSNLSNFLTVTLGNSLDLILFLDGIRVGRSSGGIDDLISQALRDRLKVSETSLSGSGADKVDGIIDSSEWRHIDGLSSNNSGSSNSGGIFSWSGVDDSINKDLDRVLVSQKVDDLKGVSADSVSHQLLTIISSTSHKTTGKSLNNWTTSLTETLLGVSSSGMWKVGSMLSLTGDIILKGDVVDLDIIEGPLSEKLDFDTWGLDLEGGNLGNVLDFLGFRHD